MGIRNNKKSDEEKMRERAAIQDSANTGSIEQQAVAQKQNERDQTENKLFDVEGARKRIQQGLLGYKKRIIQYKNPNTGEVKTEVKKTEQRSRQLCNEEAAGIFMDEANSFLNHNTITTYLPASTIQNKCKGTLQPIYKQIWKNWHIFNINGTEDAEDIVSIIRNPMIDATNKARGGRLIKNQEKIRIEKESISREGKSGDEDKTSDGALGGLF